MFTPKLSRWIVAVCSTALLTCILPTLAVTTATPAQAASKPTISANHKTVVTGQTVVLSGKIRSKAKHTVKIQVRYAGTRTWHTIKHVTAKKRAWKVTLTMADSRDRSYRAVYKRASKTISVRVDPVVTTKTVSLEFAKTTATDPNWDQCTSQITQIGMNGTRIDTYADGKLISQVVTTAAVNQVTTTGTSSAPCVTGINPTAALPGDQVTISGQTLADTTAVQIGSQAATISASSASTVTVTVPNLDAGSWPVVVTGPAGDLAAGTIKVVAPPKIDSISDTSGPLSGGSTITINGSGLSATTSVTFTVKLPSLEMSANGTLFGPAIPSLKVTVVDDTQLQVLVPAGLGGENVVTVTTPNGTTTTSYTYKLTARSGTDFEQAFLVEINKRRAAGATCYTSKGQAVVKPAVGALTWNGELSDLAMSHAAGRGGPLGRLRRQVRRFQPCDPRHLPVGQLPVRAGVSEVHRLR